MMHGQKNIKFKYTYQITVIASENETSPKEN